MKIPLGNFGNAIANPAPEVNIPRGAFDTGDGMQRIGQTISTIGAGMLRQQAEDEAQRKHEAEALARVEAGNVLLERENSIKALHADIEEKLSTGEIHHDQVQKYYENGTKALEVSQVYGLDPAGAAHLQAGLRRIDLNGVAGVRVSADRARKIEFKGAIDKMIDGLGKQAGNPGADIDQLSLQLDAMEQGRIAYGANWENVKQTAKDKYWMNSATQRAIGVHDDLAGLQQLEHDLTAADGLYADRLDTDKRNALLASVINSKSRLENQFQHQVAQRDTQANRVLDDVAKQNFSGIPPSIEMTDSWTEQVRGTGREEELSRLFAQGVQVQNLLSLPFDDVDQHLVNMQSQLQVSGGSVEEQANVERLKTIAAANRKKAFDTPLIFLGERTGMTTAELDFSKVLTGDISAIDAAMHARVSNLYTMRRQYDPDIPIKPLLPKDVDAAGRMLKQSSPDNTLKLFDFLHKSTKDAEAYKGAMQQIQPDAPVMSIAGALYGIRTTYQSRPTTMGFSAMGADLPIEVSGKKAAEYIVRGERLLNPGKDDKGINDTKLFMPKESELRTAFDEKIGDAFAGQPEGANATYKAVRAAYAGMAAGKGLTQPDTDLISTAIDAVTGGVIDAFGSKVIPPYGMPKDIFVDKVATQFTQQLKAAGIPYSNINDFKIYMIDEDTYGFTKDTDTEPLPVSIKVK